MKGGDEEKKRMEERRMNEGVEERRIPDQRGSAVESAKPSAWTTIYTTMYVRSMYTNGILELFAILF